MYCCFNISAKVFTAWKVSKYGVFSDPNTGKYGPEKTPYLDTFHAVIFSEPLNYEFDN